MFDEPEQMNQQVIYQSEGLTERINEPPWGRCLQGAVDVRWVVVVVVVVSSSPRTPSSRALGITVTLLRSNGDASMGLDDGAMRQSVACETP